MQVQITPKNTTVATSAREHEIAQNADDVSRAIGRMTSSTFCADLNFKSDSCRNMFSAKASFSLAVVGPALSIYAEVRVTDGGMVVGFVVGDFVVGVLEGADVGDIDHFSQSM